jgi:hypothetical protein
LTAVAVLFAVLNYAAINLVNLFKTPVFHEYTQNFAAYPAGAISYDWFVL